MLNSSFVIMGTVNRMSEQDRLKRIKEHNDKLIELFQLEKLALIEELEDHYSLEQNEDDYMMFMSHDPFDIERITFGHYLNNYSVMRFYCEVDQFDRNNDEIVTSDSFGCLWDSYDPEYEDDPTSVKHYNEQLKYAENDEGHTELLRWVNLPDKHINALGTDLTYSKIGDSFVCYNNITHYHTIKGYQLRVDSQFIETIVGVIKLRELFYRLGSFLSAEVEV